MVELEILRTEIQLGLGLGPFQVLLEPANFGKHLSANRAIRKPHATRGGHLLRKLPDVGRSFLGGGSVGDINLLTLSLRKGRRFSFQVRKGP